MFQSSQAESIQVVKLLHMIPDMEHKNPAYPQQHKWIELLKISEIERGGSKKQARGCQGLAPVSGTKCFQGKKMAVTARHSYAAVSAHVAATAGIRTAAIFLSRKY